MVCMPVRSIFCSLFARRTLKLPGVRGWSSGVRAGPHPDGGDGMPVQMDVNGACQQINIAKFRL